MKRLMILGGTRYVLPIIKAAHNLGVHVITCDYMPDNYAHRFSDEYCNVSIIEQEHVLKKAKELKIDGITSFACDPGVVIAAYVAEKLGLPSVGSYEAVSILQDKGKFRSYLAENGFNVPKSRVYTNIDDVLNDMKEFSYPVIAKPVDSAGSKGVTKITNSVMGPDAVKNAFYHSFKNEIIIEDYLEQIGHSSDSDSFSVDGELRFLSFNSQLFDHNAPNPYTPAGFYWEPTMSKAHQSELRDELQRLMKLLDLKTSIYNIETRECTDGKAYIMECSPRGGGNRLAECLEMAAGVNLIENTVRAALGMKITDIVQGDYNGYWGEVILHSNKTGIFEKITILDEIKDNIIETDLWIKEGDRIENFTGANTSVGTIILRFDDSSRMKEVMNDIDRFVEIEIRE